MDGEGKKSGRGRGRGRGRGGRGRARGRGRGKAASTRGRSKKMVIESDEEEQQIETSEIVDNQVDISDEADDHDEDMVIDERENQKPEIVVSKPEIKLEERSEKVEFTIDDDISQLVPPTFSTVSKGPPQPMLELTWDHKYTAMGEKLPTPNIHMCMDCRLPIRIYGRLIPCKHVYCHLCATKQNYCSCCQDRVTRIEQAHLGQVFMCHHGGTRYGFDGCRRTYLSQRDLQAHVNHRHKPRNSGGSHDHGISISPGASTSSSHSSSPYEHGGGGGGGSHYNRQNIPVHYSSSSRNNNLISVPLQTPSNSSGRQPSQGSEPTPTPGSRYERKPSFTRNTSWSSYNNRPF